MLRRSHLLAVVTTLLAGAAVTGVRATAAPAPSAPETGAMSAQPAAAVDAPAPRPALEDLVIAARPLAYWKLDDGWPTAHDRTGRHDGVLRGQIRVWQIGQGPGTLSDGFDGSTGRVTVPADGLAPGAVAASAWFRARRHASGGLGSILDTGGIDIAVDSGRLVVTTCAATLPCDRLTLAPYVADGAWHQVVVSVDGGRVQTFVDGAASGSGPTLGATARPAHGVIGIGRHFIGNIDDVALYSTPVGQPAVASQFAAGACPQAAGTTPSTASVVATLPPLPLHTRGRDIVDANGARVKFAGINWYGAEELDRVPAGLQCQSLDAIASRIAADGFNVVRLPWSTDTWHGRDPVVPPVAVAANPALRGRHARAVFDAVIDALARHGLMVVLDNHVTRPSWCCTNVDGNALWWEGYAADNQPHWARMRPRAKARYFRRHQAAWLSAWRSIAHRYGPTGHDPQPAVVGADLRNEPRVDSLLGLEPAWGDHRVPVWENWPRAATRAGNLVLRQNPRLLIVVEGVNYATDLRGVMVHPIRLSHRHRLVYSVHDYAFTEGPVSPAELRAELGARWGWLIATGRWYTTPVWVAEFGTCHVDGSGCRPREAAWFATFTRYLRDGDVDWAYWSLNGTGARGEMHPTTCAETLRFPGCDERYGLSDVTWAQDASPGLSSALRALEPPAQGG